MDTPTNTIEEISFSGLPPVLKLTTPGGARVRIPMGWLVVWRDASPDEPGNSVVIYSGANEHLKESVMESVESIDQQYEQA